MGGTQALHEWMDGWIDGCIAFLHENIAIDAAYFS